jgi:hypothetical protein
VSSENLWTEPQPNPAVAVAALMPKFDTRYKEGKWYEMLPERDQRQRDEASRVNGFYSSEARDREERENKHAGVQVG